MAAIDVELGKNSPAGIAERLRTLRAHAGLTQTELAGDRFSKEYVSQIERRKTRPSREALAYLAERLEVDPLFLETGVSSDERSRIEATLARGEALIESQKYAEAAEEFERARALVSSTEVIPELQLRALCGYGWAEISKAGGDLRAALKVLETARDLSERSRFSHVDRADVLFRMGACRYKLGSIQTSVALLSEALTLAEKSGLPCDRLRSDILRWRSRGYRRQRDWEAAHEDIERALELGEAMGDARTIANAYLHASLVAERNGQWVLARTYAERAKAEYERISDEINVGRMLNNLGALNFLLGRPEKAERLLKDAFRVAIDNDHEVDAAYAVSSLARVHLETGQPALAEEQARKALELLDGRSDYLEEIGNAQLVLGRSLMERGELEQSTESLRASQASFEQIGSPGHQSAALLARGDLATRQGKPAEAARFFRHSAELLQDVRF